jgi:three-Cys-motif partner protein
MPATIPTKFFTSYRSWQWIKHQILDQYVTRWSRMVGTFAPSIHVIDTFAGAGHYDGSDGARVEGSPIIEARACMVYNQQFSDRERTMDLFCIERDGDNFDRLAKALQPFGETVRVRRGDFVDHIPEVLQLIKSEPSQVLFDPIGLKPITAVRCRPLLARAGKTDVFVVVDFQIVHRTGGQLLASGSPDPAYKASSALAANSASAH